MYFMQGRVGEALAPSGVPDVPYFQVGMVKPPCWLKAQPASSNHAHAGALLGIPPNSPV